MTDQSEVEYVTREQQTAELRSVPPPKAPWLRGVETGPSNNNNEHLYTDGNARTVYHFAACGVPTGAISNVLGLSWVTIRKVYAEAYFAGQAEAEALIAKTPFRLAQDLSNPAVALRAAQYWLGTRHGWKEDPGSSKLPLLPVSDYDFSKLNDEQLLALQSILEQASIAEPVSGEPGIGSENLPDIIR